MEPSTEPVPFPFPFGRDDGRLEQSVTIKAIIIKIDLQQHLTLLDKLREESLGDSSVPTNISLKLNLVPYTMTNQ